MPSSGDRQEFDGEDQSHFVADPVVSSTNHGSARNVIWVPKEETVSDTTIARIAGWRGPRLYEEAARRRPAELRWWLALYSSLPDPF